MHRTSAEVLDFLTEMFVLLEQSNADPAKVDELKGRTALLKRVVDVPLLMRSDENWPFKPGVMLADPKPRRGRKKKEEGDGGD